MNIIKLMSRTFKTNNNSSKFAKNQPNDRKAREKRAGGENFNKSTKYGEQKREFNPKFNNLNRTRPPTNNRFNNNTIRGDENTFKSRDRNQIPRTSGNFERNKYTSAQSNRPYQNSYPPRDNKPREFQGYNNNTYTPPKSTFNDPSRERFNPKYQNNNEYRPTNTPQTESSRDGRTFQQYQSNKEYQQRDAFKSESYNNNKKFQQNVPTSKSSQSGYNPVITDYLGKVGKQSIDSMSKTDTEFVVTFKPQTPKKVSPSREIPEVFKSFFKEKGFTLLSDIQDIVYNSIEFNKNISFCSQPGTGKTLAYLLPLFESELKLNRNDNEGSEKEKKTKEINLIVVANLHVLEQLMEVLKSAEKSLGITSVDIKNDDSPINYDVQFVATTFSKFCELLQNDSFKTHLIKNIVIDDADIILNKNNMLEKTIEGKHLAKNSRYIIVSSTILKHKHSQSLLASLSNLRNIELNPNRVGFNTKFIFKKCSTKSKDITLLEDLKLYKSENRRVLVICHRSSTCQYLRHYLKQNNVDNLPLVPHEGNMYSKVKNFGQNCDVAICVSRIIHGMNFFADTVIMYEFEPKLKYFVQHSNHTDRWYNSYKNQPIVLTYLSKNAEVEFARQFQSCVEQNIDLAFIKTEISQSYGD